MTERMTTTSIPSLPLPSSSLSSMTSSCLPSLSPSLTSSSSPSSSLSSLPLHPRLLTGIIPNHHLSYYILSNSRPKDCLELRLIVSVGSLMENDDEQGLAHFVEHLGFKGTKSYVGYELVKTLQSLGITYGADLNASTHLLETTYRLSLQTDENLSQLKVGLNILKEWAFFMNISESDVQEERNVISSEYLAKQGLGQRLLLKYWSKLFGTDISSQASRLATRMPIGIPEIFMNTNSVKIREFYEKWYRPENMAIVVVGDFSGKETMIQEFIENIFQDIGKPLQTIPEVDCCLYNQILALKSSHLQLPSHINDVVICLEDRELTVPQLSFEFFYPARNSNTVSFVRDNILHRLMTSLLDRRFHGLVQKERLLNDSKQALFGDEVPLQSLGMSVRELVRGLVCVGITATLKLSSETDSEEKSSQNQLNPAVETALRLLLLELRRLRTYGIHEAELDDAKKKWSYLFKDQRDHQTTSSSSLASDLSSHILSSGQTVFACPIFEADLTLDVMDKITVEEMNQFLTKVIDMDISEEESNYYQPNPFHCSFRSLSAQIPLTKNNEGSRDDSDYQLQSALTRARDYVNSLPSVDPWPLDEVISEEEVILAAQTVIRHLTSNEQQLSEVVRDSEQDEFKSNEEKIFPVRQPFNLCLCCKKKNCLLSKSKQGQSMEFCVPLGAKVTEYPPNVSVVPIEGINATEITLSNGMKICVKQMPEGSDSPGRISMQGFALGGCTELNETEDSMFSMLDSICAQSSLYIGPLHQHSTSSPHVGMYFGEGDCADQHSGTERHRILSGKSINHIQSVSKTRVNTQRHLNFRGIGGSSPSEKFELLLAFLTLRLTCQQIDHHAFEDTLQSQKSGLSFRENSPEHTFMERARILSCGDIPYSRPLSLEVLDHVSLDMARTLYARAFLNDPTEFTFVFVGDLPPLNHVVKLLNFYIGSFSSPRSVTTFEWRKEETLSSYLPFTSIGTDFFIKERNSEVVHLRQGDKASSLFVFRALLRNYREISEWIEEEKDLSQTIALDIACRVLQAALLDSLRIDMGKVYSVSVDFSRGSLSPVALVSIGLHCHPSDLPSITHEIERCIEFHRENGPDEKILTGIIEALITKQKNALKCPSHWLFWILDTYKSYRIYEWKMKMCSDGRSSSDWVKHFAFLRSQGKIGLISQMQLEQDKLIDVYRIIFDLSKSVQVTLCSILPSDAETVSPSSSPE